MTGDTKVNMKLFEEDHDKTVILPDFGEGMPVPDTAKGPAATAMKTNPQMEFTPEDFEQYAILMPTAATPTASRCREHRRKRKKMLLLFRHTVKQQLFYLTVRHNRAAAKGIFRR